MFNEEKLLWMNKEHIKQQSENTQLEQIKKFMPNYSDELLKKLRPLIIDRISTYGELKIIEQEEFRLFLERPKPEGGKLVWKDDGKDNARNHLTHVVEMLMQSPVGTPEEVKALIMPYADVSGRGNVLWPLRVALSGKEKSVDPFSLIAYLGKDESLARIQQALDVLAS